MEFKEGGIVVSLLRYRCFAFWSGWEKFYENKTRIFLNKISRITGYFFSKYTVYGYLLKCYG